MSLKIMKRIKEEDVPQTTNDPPIVMVKRPRRTVSAQSFDHIRACQEIYDVLRTYKLADGRILCESFLRLPSKKIMPEYHSMISLPIDFMRIQQKIKTEEYTNIEQMASDIRLLVENSKSYYKKNSQEYKDASDLLTLFNETKAKLNDFSDAASDVSYGRSDNSSPAPSTRSLRSSSPSRSIRGKETSPARMSASETDLTDPSVLEQFLASVLTVNDESGRRICHAFVVLPSKDEYPDYYRVIKNPVDLKMIADRLRSGHYKTLRELEKDLIAMSRNAQRYNEPKSLIYKDANFLRRFITAKRSEFVDIGPDGIEKIKNPNAAQLIDDLLCFSHPSGQGANVLNVLDEDSEDEDTKFVPDDKFSALYTTIRYAKDDEVAHDFFLRPKMSSSMDLIEPFLRLPSKIFYPDYYDEIKYPMSLFIINRKIKMDDYNNFEEMVADVNLMFNNAKSYNVEGSTIYANACKLQAICNAKVHELDPSIDTTQYVLCDYTYEPSDQDDSTNSSFPDSSSASLTLMQNASSATPTGSKVPRPRNKNPNPNLTLDGRPKQKPGRKSMGVLMERYRSRLQLLYKSIAQYKDANGRLLSELFMSKPSKKLYPNYYDVIQNPIDLTTIKANIDGDKYATSEMLVSDLELLFNNAKTYNEQRSQIYKDAETLSKILQNTARCLGPTAVESPKLMKEKFGWHKVRETGEKAQTATSPTKVKGSGKKPKENSSTPTLPKKLADRMTPKKFASVRLKMQLELYNAIKDYKDAKGRVLSHVFMKLPTKSEYPDYYDVIKKPIDLQKISGKIMSNNQYPDLDALVQDFTLMFDNACSYNDPESMIYKDALTLQGVLLQKKAEIQKDEQCQTAPDVHAALHELITNLFIAVYNFQDAEGRCYSDSLAELPDLIKDKENTQPPFSLDDVKRNIDRYRYRRFDRFQQDVFEVFDKARQLTRSDSEIFLDSIELQKFFIKTRDELCKDGKFYYTPSLSFDLAKFDAVIAELKSKKQAVESSEDAANEDKADSSQSSRKEGDTELDQVEINSIVYKRNDFVYIKRNEDDKLESHVMRIARIWKDKSAEEIFISGNWFYRPYETYHLATRKFLEKEVFLTEIYDMVDAARLLGKCFVMYVRDYLKFTVNNFDAKDVYCCESKYLGRIMKHSFQKLTHWPYDTDRETVEFSPRPQPLKPHRNPSVFVGSKKAEFAAALSPVPSNTASTAAADKDVNDDEDYSLLDSKREEVLCPSVAEAMEQGTKFYEQIDCGVGMWLKIGEAIYVKAEKSLPDIVRLEKMWRNENGEIFLSGTWFARPYDVSLPRDYQFYKKELFATKRVQILPVNHILARCVILSLEQYLTMRYADITDEHVFLCRNSITDEPISKATSSDYNSLEPYEPTVPKLSEKVLAYEILYFKKAIEPPKVNDKWFAKEENIMSQTVMCEFGSLVNCLDLNDLSLLKTIPKLGARSKSGYILFSAVIRKKIMRDNPSCPFGQISKLVGLEWKRLSEFEKKRFEEEAEKIAQARAKVDQENGGKFAIPPGHIRVWFCKWRHCDFQFETSDQLCDHITNAHTSQIIEGGENQYICLWQTCTKYRKDGKPFPSLPRLNRHMKEKHVQVQSSTKCMLPSAVGRNFVSLSTPNDESANGAIFAGVHGQSSNHSTSSGGFVQSAAMGKTVPASTVFPQQQQTFVASNNQNVIGSVAQSVARFQTPPPQLGVTATNTVLVDSQGNIISSGQPYNVYQIQQSVVPNPQPMSSIVEQPIQEHQQQQQMLQQQKQTIPESGRMIVKSQRIAEPIFVIPPQRVQRVLHSEVYFQYLENLNKSQPEPSVSRWDRYLSATPQNTRPPAASASDAETFFDQRNGNQPYARGNKDELNQALWNLRNHLMYDSLGLYKILNIDEM